VKVLVISAEVWRNDKNGGNVLSNIFGDTGYEFAQIYCNPGNPSNHLCKRYYQMTDSMMINAIFHKSKPGKLLNYQEFPCDENEVVEEKAEQENRSFYDFFRSHRLEVFYIIRSIIWKLAKWDTQELREFIESYNPDIIFAPCYASHEMLAIDRMAKQLAKVPMISYISDDNYGLRQFRISPLYWINRFVLRRNMRKTFKMYDLVYTMTDEQKQEYEKALHCKMKILRKSGDFKTVPEKKIVNKPIRMIYAGGIYVGRWKTLAKIAEAIREINKDGIKVVLDIYTGNTLTERQKVLLNDGINCRVHKSISLNELKKEYAESDIALHVESFELKYKLLSRISFSTKIIDCLSSGCATMAICWNQHSGYIYLKKHDIAICVDAVDKISNIIKNLIRNPEQIIDYADKAREFGLKHHQQEYIKKEFMTDLESYMTE
jgi:hypothetical protein